MDSEEGRDENRYITDDEEERMDSEEGRVRGEGWMMRRGG